MIFCTRTHVHISEDSDPALLGPLKIQRECHYRKSVTVIWILSAKYDVIAADLYLYVGCGISILIQTF